ncbi:hypothetical protein FACS1894156_3960 [Bacteroidia bacterium]|nr:hypothetical protein FACS1894156_3960 [Bacteroidia bacterium]
MHIFAIEFLIDDFTNFVQNSMITINSTDYECIERTANEIEQGYKRILRLPESAEKGRILGGQKAIEASLVVGTTETTNRAEFDVDTIKKMTTFHNIWKN